MFFLKKMLKNGPKGNAARAGTELFSFNGKYIVVKNVCTIDAYAGYFQYL